MNPETRNVDEHTGADSLDAEFEVIEIAAGRAGGDSWFGRFKQQLMLGLIITSAVVLGLLLLWLAFYVFLAVILIGLLLRVFGVVKPDSLKIYSQRFRR